jgi:hypothetical protein
MSLEVNASCLTPYKQDLGTSATSAQIPAAVRQHRDFFKKPPRAYGYDRGGWSQENVRAIRQEGVREVGLAPRGQAKWPVEGRSKERLVNERAQVEGSIGAIKNSRYGFNRPRARSVAMMGFCGQRAAFGYNINKVVRGLCRRRKNSRSISTPIHPAWLRCFVGYIPSGMRPPRASPCGRLSVESWSVNFAAPPYEAGAMGDDRLTTLENIGGRRPALGDFPQMLPWMGH